MSKELLLVFVKHPIPGQVKTRLAATVGDGRALRIYNRLLSYTLAISQEILADKAVFYGNEVPQNDLWQQAGYRRFLQKGEDLGARMQQAFDWGFTQGYDRIVIIGSDCAQLTADHLRAAFAQLENYDSILGPAHDGGYYLLGLKASFSPIFENKNWSTNQILKASLYDLISNRKSIKMLPTLSDIDHEEDLKGTFLEKEGY